MVSEQQAYYFMLFMKGCLVKRRTSDLVRYIEPSAFALLLL